MLDKNRFTFVAELFFEIEPQPKQRPRFGRNRRAYTPQQTQNFENFISAEAKKQLIKKKILRPMEGPVGMELTFAFTIPASFSLKKTKSCMNQETLHTKRVDIDNCLKSVSDALNKIAYVDDGQIVWVSAAKIYAADKPYIKIRLFEII